MSFWSAAFPLVAVGGSLVVLMMFLLWMLHLQMKNASVVDPGWAYGLAILAVTYAVMGPGYAPRRWVAAAMAAVWGIRLGTHLLRRIIGQPEEGRYQQLRKEWGKNVALKFLVFFELQALLDIVLSLPFLLASLNTNVGLSAVEFAGFSLWLVAVLGEAISDSQLSAFKRDHHGTKEVCRRGLWKYSRHPNYFFEWLTWMAWAVFAIASPHGWAAIICPVLMLYFLFRVTGIPATEAQALRRKGDAYRQYQRTTSAFVPWFSKNG